VIEVGSEHSLMVIDIALPSGFGVARLGEMVVFVPGGLPGDTVQARIVKLEKRFAYGETVRIEEASPFRRDAQCPHLGECGGCELHRLAYEKQIEIKENHLRQVLKRIGGPEMEQVPISPMVPSVDIVHYRSKIELTFGESGDGTVVGMVERLTPLRPFTGRVIPVDDCLLFSPVAARIVPVIRDFAAKSGLRAHDPNTGKGTLRRLVIREGKGTGEVMVNVIAANDISGHVGPLSKALPEAVAELRSLYAGSSQRPRLLWGRPYIEEILGDLSLRVYPSSFFQPNPKTAEVLYSRMRAASQIRGDERVLGLYCGAGAIELFLARHVKEAWGIDSSADSIACARENAALNDLKNVRFTRDRVEATIGRKEGRKADLVVMDPPRSGLSGEALKAVLRAGVKKVVYVSCNPSTLARDLKGLKKLYEPKEIIPFDFFPHTSHFEVLAILEKRAHSFHAVPDRS